LVKEDPSAVECLVDFCKKSTQGASGPPYKNKYVNFLYGVNHGLIKEKDMNKKDLDALYKKYEPALKKTGVQLSKAIKAAEEDVVKMYKVAQNHIEIQMKNIRKEKIYYDLGKAVAKKLLKGEIDFAGADKYKKDLEKLNEENVKIQKRIKAIGKKTTKK